MTREDILTEVYNSDIIQKIASKYKSWLGNNIDDFVSHCLVIACEIPEKKLKKLYNDGQLYFYIVASCRNQAFNPKSTFHKECDMDMLPLFDNTEDKEEDDA